MQTATELDLRGLDTALAMLPEGINLASEEDFVQAGILLISQIKLNWIAIGELLEWKMRMERAMNDESRDAIFNRYAREWGTSHTSLVRAWVSATKFPEINRPEDVSHTTAYEVVSGSETPEQAEAGFQTVAQDGMGVQQVREAKALQRMGLNSPLDWHVPFLFYRGDDIWGRTHDGYEVRIWTPVKHKGALEREVAKVAVAVARMRLGV